MFFYFKSISLNSSALTGKSNTAADLHIQAALSCWTTHLRKITSRLPSSQHAACCYIELFPFVVLPYTKKCRMRRAWIIAAFQETMMNFISVQSILHEFTRSLYSELTYVLQSCHFKLLTEWCWVADYISLYGYSPFRVGWWAGIKLYMLWWKSIQSMYLSAHF